MSEDAGIGEMAQIISVSMNGMKFGVELTKEAIQFAKKVAMLFAMGGKFAYKKVKYKDKAGKTSLDNFMARTSGNRIMKCLDEENFLIWKELSKSHGILFVELPCDKEGIHHFYIAQEDMPTYNELERDFIEASMKRNMKNGMEKDSAQEKAEHENRTETLSEYVHDAGFEDMNEKEFQQFCEKWCGEHDIDAKEIIVAKKNDSLAPDMKSKIEKAFHEDRLINKMKSNNTQSFRFGLDQIINVEGRNEMKGLISRYNPDRVLIVDAKELLQKSDKKSVYVALEKDKTVLLREYKRNPEGTRLKDKSGKDIFTEKELNFNEFKEILSSEKDGFYAEKKTKSATANTTIKKSTLVQNALKKK
jgi:hypothetical protein